MRWTPQFFLETIKQSIGKGVFFFFFFQKEKKKKTWTHRSLKSLSVFLGLFAWPNTSHYNLINFFFFLECTPPHIFYLQIEKRTKCVGVGAGAGNDGGRHS